MLASKEPESVVFVRAFLTRAVLPSKVGGDEYDRYDTKKSCGGDSSLPPQDLTLIGKQTTLVPLPDMNTTLRRWTTRLDA